MKPGMRPQIFLIKLSSIMIQSTGSERERLLAAIHPIIVEKGIKATTMDLVAQRLGMSKRTLYEIFENKNAMMIGVLEHHANIDRKNAARIFETAPNAMIALIRIFDMHRKNLIGMNVSFFKDMDRLYPELRQDYEKRHQSQREGLQKLYQRGVAEGVFRGDINFLVFSKMMEIQAESLKRMEKLFPPEITLIEIYDTMYTLFLRSIASRLGNDLLDTYLANNSSRKPAAGESPAWGNSQSQQKIQ